MNTFPERAAVYIRLHTTASMLVQDSALRERADRLRLTVAAMYHDNGRPTFQCSGFLVLRSRRRLKASARMLKRFSST